MSESIMMRNRLSDTECWLRIFTKLLRLQSSEPCSLPLC